MDSGNSNILVILLLAIMPALLLLLYLIKYFEFSFFFLMLAPLLSAFFIPNIITLKPVPTIGSYLRIVIIFFICIVSFIYIVKHWPKEKIRLSNPILLLIPILLVAFFSLTYSIDQSITIIRASTFLFIIVFCFGIYLWLHDESDFQKLLNVIYYFTIFFIFINLIVIVLLPSKAWWITDPNRLEGVFSQPNSLGAESRDLFFILLWKYPNSKSNKMKIWVIVLMGILILFIMLSGSRTSLLTLILGILAWLIFNKKKFKIILFFIILFHLVALFPLIEPSNLSRGKGTSVTDLTGRTEFWTNALILISERPLSGYGFEVGGKVWEDPRFHNPKLALWAGSARQSLHNGYISTAIGIGVPGLVLWLFIIFLPLIKLNWRKLTPEISFFLIIIIIYLISNFDESTIGGGSEIFWLSWSLIIAFERKIFPNKIPQVKVN